MEIIGIEAGDLSSFNIENFGLTKLGQGELRAIWYDENALLADLTAEKGLFKIHVKFLRQVCELEQVMKLDNAILLNGLFDKNGNPQEATIAVEIIPETIRHRLLNVYPNPFSNSLTFEFSLDNAEQIAIRLSDGYGNTQYFQSNYLSGLQTHTIQNLTGLQDGLLYYTINLGNEVFTGNVVKMQ